MKVIKEYKSHHYVETWEVVDGMFCPTCGTKGEVWHETGAGDYYVGETHLCLNCIHTFTIQGPEQVRAGFWRDELISIAYQLKTKTTATPTTPKGK